MEGELQASLLHIPSPVHGEGCLSVVSWARARSSGEREQQAYLLMNPRTWYQSGLTAGGGLSWKGGCDSTESPSGRDRTPPAGNIVQP